MFDYVYKPVSFLKRSWGKWGAVYAVMITFFLCGLWHGAKWTFVAWGIINGIALSIEIITDRFRRKKLKTQNSKFLGISSALLTFTFVCLAFIVARANSIPEAFDMLGSLFHLSVKNLIGLPVITKFSFAMNFVFIFLLMG